MADDPCLVALLPTAGSDACLLELAAVVAELWLRWGCRPLRPTVGGGNGASRRRTR